MSDLDLTARIIDVRDIIARFEELESQMPDGDDARNWPDAAEFAQLSDILEELSGNGGDEQWRGDWYPTTLIWDSYFPIYARDLLIDCGDISANLPHYVHIDWKATSRDLLVDYTSLDINGLCYWFR